MTKIKNIKEVTEPLKEEILKGDVHTIEEMRAWLKPLGYSDTINEAAINFILREFVMSIVSSDCMMNADMVVELLRPQLEVTKEDIEPIFIMGLYHHRNLVGSSSAFIKGNLKLCRGIHDILKSVIKGRDTRWSLIKQKSSIAAGLPFSK